MKIRIVLNIQLAMMVFTSVAAGEETISSREVIDGRKFLLGASGVPIGETGYGVIESIVESQGNVKIGIYNKEKKRFFEIHRDHKFNDFIRGLDLSSPSTSSLVGQSIAFQEFVVRVGFPREFIEESCDIVPGPFFQLQSSFLISSAPDRDSRNNKDVNSTRTGQSVNFTDIRSRRMSITGELGVPLGTVVRVRCSLHSDGIAIERDSSIKLRYKFDEIDFVNCGTTIDREKLDLATLTEAICFEGIENFPSNGNEVAVSNIPTKWRRRLILKVHERSLK